MAKVICDTDVMIDYFDQSKPRHAGTVKELEKNINLDNVLISAISKIELFNKEINSTLNFLFIFSPLTRLFSHQLINYLCARFKDFILK